MFMSFSNCTIWFVCFLLILIGSTISSWNSLININGLVSSFSLIIAVLAFLNAKQTREDNQKHKLIELKREVTKGFAELINSWNNARVIVEKSEITKKEYSEFIKNSAKNANDAFELFKSGRDRLSMDEILGHLYSLDFMQIQMRGDVEIMKIRTEEILELKRNSKTVQHDGCFEE